MKPTESPPLPVGALQRSETLAEKVYRSVLQKIASGALDPSRKMTETQMAEWLGVSRTPVREALARLRREGLLNAPGMRSARLSRADIEEILELRLLLEPYLAARAAERATPDSIAELEHALAEEARTLPRKSAQQFVMANHAFRQALMRVAGNSRLAEAAARHDAQIQALRRATLTRLEHRKTVLKHHQALVSAIRAGDRERAESCMRALMNAASDTMLALASAPAGRRR